MQRSKLEKLITDFVVEHDLDAQFVQQTEGLTSYSMDAEPNKMTLLTLIH